MASGMFDYPDATGIPASDGMVFLADWSEEDWARLLRHTDTRHFATGDTVIQAGESDRSLYIVAAGRLEILRPRDRAGGPESLAVVYVCEPGGVIGEQAFVDGRPRSATVRSIATGRLTRLTIDGFETFSGHYPALARRFLFDLARILSLRLRQTNAILERGDRG